MASLLHDVLRGQRLVLENQETRSDENSAPSYVNWGFTMYRTAYGPASEKGWQMLIDTIRAKVHDEIQDRGDAEDAEDIEAMEKLLSLFQLDLRSDPNIPNNASMDHVRQLHMESHENPDTLMFAGAPSHGERLFLADNEVLADAATGDFWVKCVQANYNGSYHAPRNSRMTHRQYFGWMKMAARSLLSLWYVLETRSLENIAPPTVGGMHLEKWDGTPEF